MTVAVWIALGGALAALVGQWGTGRLFARLKAIEDRQDKIDKHLETTDKKVETMNEEGSTRHDAIQKQYWDMKEKITILQTINDRRESPREDRKSWPR